MPGLWALNIDPEKAADDYRERVIGRSALREAARTAKELQALGIANQ